MVIQNPEITPVNSESLNEKEVIINWLRPQAIDAEVAAMADEGYRIDFGDTYDQAYEDPELIKGVFNWLKVDGEIFESARRTSLVGNQAVRDALMIMPSGGLKTAIRKRIAGIDAHDETVRESILYGRIDVQGMSWHKQNGKALALGTIVDAYELQTIDREDDNEGSYDKMSGRLTADILTHTFGENTGWMQGLTLEEALRHTMSSPDFRVMATEKADEKIAQSMQDLREFVEAPVHHGFKDIVVNCTDSLGIRSRKEEVRAEINRFVEGEDQAEFLLMSFGCGTAQPMLEVIQDLKAKGKEAKLILLDQDPIALAAAEQIAGQMGLQDAIEIHCRQMFVGKGKSTRIMNIQDVLQGRELDVCEDSGLREYFTDGLYKDLAGQAWGALRPGGLMTTGNMNKNRPQPEFLHGLMGWSIPVRMRHAKDLARLHQAAGVPREATRFRVTQDGVYTLCFSTKAV